MRPMAAALTGALISGVAMFAVGTRAQNQTIDTPVLVQTADGRYAYAPVKTLQPVPFAAPQPMSFSASPAPLVTTAAAPARVVYQTVERPATRVVDQEQPRRHRSWKKSALVIGGSAASGAGVGALVGGKKGALIGTALGGGAASIYEATRR